ncbi:flagellar hook-basal body protein [Humisphaera borealis]|uniref:Flagellar hook protein FlgE/F/G-like D1 domain-containing protein n=1 Tax=Humisphaera borealis TaxID=2807512 RepID=A0A7M2WT99_9BACT|nr:flagellar basal body rod C-terminal domain-containing protein [Humisphaera borealis]QOV87830.1 hypothetical protein IPV69_16245 [Humisphaera borealis]
MTLVFHSRTGSTFSLVVAAARQVLIAGAAVAGVLAFTGCSRAPAASATAAPATMAPPERYGQSKTTGQRGYAQPGTGVADPTMAAPLNRQPETAIFDDPTRPLPSRPSAKRPVIGPEDGQYATNLEKQRASPQAINDLIVEATTPGPMPSYRRGGAGVLGEADRAVAPLTDTLAAIDAGTRAIVDNLRHADVPGFKVTRTAIGDGRDAASQLDVSAGELQVTDRALDIAIQGEGFLPVRFYTKQKPEGAVAYTRNGALFMNATGDIVVGDIDGFSLMPAMKFPPGVTQVTITQDGRMQVGIAGSDQPKDLGHIRLAVFADPTALRPLGGGLYAETEASGPATEQTPGTRAVGRIAQGQLERSNLDLIKERMRLKFLQNWRASIVGALDGSTKLEQR